MLHLYLSIEKILNVGYLEFYQDKMCKNLPTDRLSVWIQRGNTVSDEDILELIKKEYIQDSDSVTLLYLDPEIVHSASLNLRTG